MIDWADIAGAIATVAFVLVIFPLILWLVVIPGCTKDVADYQRVVKSQPDKGSE
jgi:hypothetical protein